jgi:hypothetical protein
MYIQQSICFPTRIYVGGKNSEEMFTVFSIAAAIQKVSK